MSITTTSDRNAWVSFQAKLKALKGEAGSLASHFPLSSKLPDDVWACLEEAEHLTEACALLVDQELEIMDGQEAGDLDGDGNFIPWVECPPY